METNAIDYSIVVPLFNEEANIQELYRRLTDTMGGLKKEYELIFVDDGSGDKTFEMLKRLHESDRHVAAFRLSRNFGQHPAAACGLYNARGRAAVTLDGDLQNLPEDIPKLISKLEEGYDVVAGYREERDVTLARRIGSRMVNILISRLTGVKLRDYGCMLRAYSRFIVDSLNKCGEHATYITALTAWVGGRVTEVPIGHSSRKKGKSKYNFKKLARLYLNILTGFSDIPLKLVMFAGVVISLFGTLSMLLGKCDFSISLVILACGIQLIALGAVGAYVSRIYIEVQNRPYYVVKERAVND